MKRGEDGKWRTVGGVEVPDFEPRYSIIESLIRTFPFGRRFRIDHDGFVGTICGWYVRDDGRPGVCLQLDNAKVVHVYGLKWLQEVR